MVRQRLQRYLLRTVCAAALLASGASAQDAGIRVRAGEHADYTRLVLDAPRGSDFSWGIEGDRLVLTMDDGARLDIAVSPRQLGLSRIDTLTGGQRLEVALACQCGARTMRLDDGRIIVDIALGAARPPLPETIRAAAEPAPTAQDTVDATPPEPQAPETPVASPSLTTPETQAQATQPTPVVPRPRPEPVVPPAPPPAAAPAQETAPVVARTAEAEPARQSQAASPKPTAAESEATAPVVPTPAAAPPALAEAAAEEPADATALPAPSVRPAPEPEPTREAVGETTDSPPADDAQAAGSNDAPAMSETERAVQAARNALIEQLRRAADEGYVTLADPDTLPEPTALPEPEGGADSTAEAENLPIRARTGSEIEEANRDALGLTAENDMPAHCLPDSQFAVATWTSDAPIMLQIGAHRRSLVGEFDSTTSATLLAYVRLLIANGFGLEARGAMEAFADQLPPSPLLADMGRLVDGNGVDSDGELAMGLDCPGAHKLWATTAAALDGRLTPEAIDIAALRDPVSAVPPRLRTTLVLPIATALLEADMITEAELLAGMAARAEPPPPDGNGFLTILLARIDAARGDWTRAEAAIEPMLTKTSPAAIEAMVRMVEFRRAQQKAVPPGLAENMEALAFTLGGTDLGRKLLASAAKARAAGQGLGLALAALKRLDDYGKDKDTAVDAARDMLVDYKPMQEAGAAYAEAVITHEALIGEGPEGDRARLSIARNLIDIGLGNLAEDILAPALERGSPAASILAAQAATESADPSRALEMLDGLTGERAARQRAAAFAALGNYAAAAEAAADTGDAVFEARYAWLAGNWEAAAAAGDADRRILAAWMAGRGEMPAELAAAAAEDPSLAATMETFSPAPDRGTASLLEAAGSALEESRRRREKMGVLLEDG